MNKTICAYLFLLFSFFGFAQTITVNSTNYKQTIDMIGGDIERNSKAIQSAKNKSDIIDWGFKDINFNVCRVQYDKNQELVEGVKNWDFYSKQVATMQQIKAVNPGIKFFATMRSDYDGFGDDNNMPDWIHTYSTKATDVTKYGVFLADYCEFMSQHGVGIDILSTAKEWMWHVRASEAEDIIHTMNSELESRGIPKPIIIDQGFWSISAGLTYLNNVESLGTKDLYSGFCSHNYSNLGPEKWVEITDKAVALGKPMYDDETSTGSGSPTYGVEREMYKQIGEYIKKAQRYEAGISGEVYFEIWSRGIDKETRAIYFPASGTGRRLRGYYMMKQFSNNILDHTYITTEINNLSDVHTITFRKEDKIVLWVINEGGSKYIPSISLDQSTIIGNVETHYWTNDTAIEGAKTTYLASGNTFVPTIEAESMNCYIFDVTEGAMDECAGSNDVIIEAECFDAMSGVKTELSSEGTDNISYIEHGDWLKFESMDLDGVAKFNARVASDTSGGEIEVRIGSETGDLIATLTVDNTNGWQNYKTVGTTVDKQNGFQDLYLVFKGGTGSLFNLNWFSLEKGATEILVTATTGNAKVKLDWSMQNLEPGTLNIYRNTYLSETNRTLIAENINTTDYIDETVKNGETYWYWIENLDSFSVLTASDPIKVSPSIPNLALAENGSIATQSSTAYNGPPELAIDGNTDGNFGSGSVTHTEHGANGSETLKWWQVDLQKNYVIETINVFNRTGSNYGERLNNYTVVVLDENENITFSELFIDYPNPSTTIATGGVSGKIVKISKTSDYGITLAEVQVFGVEESLSNDLVVENSKLEIYPNPVEDCFMVTNYKGAVLELYNSLSEVLLRRKIITSSESIDIKSFPSGIYFVRIAKFGKVFNAKLVKK